MSRTASSSPLLGVSLDGLGWHAGAAALGGGATHPDAERLVQLARLADRAGFDLISLDDSLDPLGAGARPAAALDAVIAMARLAPVTSTAALLATVTTTHTEPFHVSKNLATLDLVSAGRAAWRVRCSATDAAAERFGRKPAAPPAMLSAEAADAIEVVRRLWDSWEDDAVIRDRSTGRYLDRDKVHYIDFSGDHFSVRGPSITPRPPQGQPIVVIDADDLITADVIARYADVVVVRPDAVDDVAARGEAIRERLAWAGRDPSTVLVVLELRVGEPSLRRQLDAAAGSTAAVGADLVADADSMASTLAHWHQSGVADGFLLLPDALPASLEWLGSTVVPRVRELTAPVAPVATTLRERLGLERPRNRYEVTPT